MTFERFGCRISWPSCPSSTTTARPRQRWYPFWLEAGLFPQRARILDDRAGRSRYTHRHSAAERDRRAAPGARAEQHAARHLIRWKRMQGFNALWMPGTDHAGIATQAVVERRLLEEEKKTRHDLGRERNWSSGSGPGKTNTKPASSASSSRWAAAAIGSGPGSRSTRVCAGRSAHTFFHMFRDGLIYRGKRLVNWDSFLQTAVSDDEVFHETVAGHFWHFRYPVIDPQPGEPDARHDRHHAARNDARRHGRGRASRSGRGTRSGRS